MRVRDRIIIAFCLIIGLIMSWILYGLVFGTVYFLLTLFIGATLFTVIYLVADALESFITRR